MHHRINIFNLSLPINMDYVYQHGSSSGVGTASQPADLLTKPGNAASLELYGDLLSGVGTCPQTRQLFPGIGA